MVVCHRSVTSFKSPLEACGVGGEGKKGGESSCSKSQSSSYFLLDASWLPTQTTLPEQCFRNWCYSACRLPEEPRVTKAVGRTAAFTSCTVQCVYFFYLLLTWEFYFKRLMQAKPTNRCDMKNGPRFNLWTFNDHDVICGWSAFTSMRLFSVTSRFREAVFISGQHCITTPQLPFSFSVTPRCLPSIVQKRGDRNDKRSKSL